MPLPLSRICVRQYRSFRDESVLDLRRLTLLYGTNNSGKSALARLIPWVADSLKSPGTRPTPGVNLRSPVLRGAGFKQVLWAGALGEDEPPQLDLELYCRDVELRVGLAWFEPLLQPAITSFAAKTPTDEITARWVAQRTDRHAEARSYRRVDTGESLQVTFDGLLPSCQELPWLQHIRDCFLPIQGAVTWLGPVRSGPGRTFRTDIGTGALRDGGGDAQLLVYTNPELRQRVSSFYEELTQMRLDVQTLDSALAKLVLSRVRETPLVVDFPDTGEGLQHLFSVLVGLEQLREDVPGILIVEEPDSHLHPEAQRLLAARIAEIAHATSNVQIVLETHSEVLLTAIQTEVAAARLAPTEVACHWVEQDLESGVSSVTLIELDAEGYFVSNEFHAAFRHLGELRKQLLHERKEQHAR